MPDIVFDPLPYFALYSHFNEYNRRLVEVVRPLLPCAVSKVLDLGCGIGLSTLALRAVFPGAEIEAVDRSTPMIEYARATFAGAGVSFNVGDAGTFLTRSAERRFDLVFVKSAYHLFEHEAPLGMLARLLREEGALVIAERTERSAKSYPLFAAATSHWSSYFDAVRQAHRLEAARRADLEVRVTSCGEYVGVPFEAYINAIRAGQLSFLQPFPAELIESWCASELTREVSEVLVFEEFWAYVHLLSRTARETAPR